MFVGEPADELPHAGDSETGDRVVLDVTDVAGILEDAVRRRVDRPANLAPPSVEQPVMGDREQPRPELPLTSVEPLQVPHDLEEDLAHDVVGLGGTSSSDVPTHRRDQVAVQGRPGPLGAEPSRSDHLREVFSEHQIEVSTLPIEAVACTWTLGLHHRDDSA